MPDIITTESAVRAVTELVQCPSVTPGTGPVTGPPYGEAALAALLTAKTEAMGAEVELREVEPQRPNFIARFPGRDSSRSLMLEAHADTVVLDGMTIDPFAAEVRDGRLYGRGACDTKGSMAAMLLAIERVLAREGRMPIDVYFVATCGEEVTGVGAKALMDDGFRVDAAIVGEPTDLNIIHASKGSGRFRIKTRGRAAHSSTPDDGVNAIYDMAAIVAAIEGRVAPALAAQSDPLLGSPTISIGTIAGGVQVNIVPEQCEIDVDTRLIPGQTPRAMADLIRAAVDDVHRSRPNCDAVVLESPAYPAFVVDAADPLVTMLDGVCRDVLGRSTVTGAPWASNAGVFAAAGIPSVLFGPGSIAQAHTADEWIEIDQVVAAAGVYAAAITRYSNAAS